MKDTILAFDFGLQRIGVAIAESGNVKPLLTIKTSEFKSELDKLINKYNPDKLVVGLPRNLDGNDTFQTTKVRQFAKELENQTQLEVVLQDELLSTERADSEINKKQNLRQRKAVIDKLSAKIILEDFLKEN